MRGLLARRAARRAAPAGIVGTARIDRRTKDLIKRLEPGDIAVIAHRDIDRIAAEGLIEAGVAAIVNADASISGRYPNGGPIRIVKADIPLIDQVGTQALTGIREGEQLRVVDGEVYRGEELLAEGHLLTADEIESAMAEARSAIGGELERFAVNTLEYIQREARQTFEPVKLPPLETSFEGRHALVVI